MTAFLPWFLANWLPLTLGLAFAVVFLALLITGSILAFCSYLRHWVIELFREPEAEVGYAIGDVVNLPDEAKKRRAA